uniref:Uncharacterized protein n=1 Tax=Leersia perrieri TaxID=77586 RepID=A0A0D9WNC4_9ORYZ
MADEEHEVYGQEIPLDGEDVDMSAAGDEAAKVPEASNALLALSPGPLGRNPSFGPDLGFPAAQMQELDEMKRRLKEMEEEANALRDMQAKVAKEMQGLDPNATSSESKEEMDARSVYVGNLKCLGGAKED